MWEYTNHYVPRLTEDWTLEGCETSENEGLSYVYETLNGLSDVEGRKRLEHFRIIGERSFTIVVNYTQHDALTEWMQSMHNVQCLLRLRIIRTVRELFGQRFWF